VDVIQYIILLEGEKSWLRRTGTSSKGKMQVKISAAAGKGWLEFFSAAIAESQVSTCSRARSK